MAAAVGTHDVGGADLSRPRGAGRRRARDRAKGTHPQYVAAASGTAFAFTRVGAAAMLLPTAALAGVAAAVLRRQLRRSRISAIP